MRSWRLGRLAAEAQPGAQVAVPVNATWRVNEVLAELGGEVVWTQIGGANLMDVAVGSGATIAASTDGRFGFPPSCPPSTPSPPSSTCSSMLAARRAAPVARSARASRRCTSPTSRSSRPSTRRAR